MGVFDFVRNGVREMMVARPDDRKHLIVYKHPDQNIPMYSQLTVDSDECAVFFRGWACRWRHRAGTGDSGVPEHSVLELDRHAIHGGQVFVTEIFFVTMAPGAGRAFRRTCGRHDRPADGRAGSAPYLRRNECRRC